MSRPDSTGFTPKGQRTPRGDQPRHTPRGGRLDNPGRRQDDSIHRDSEGRELRDSLIDSAFKQPLEAVPPNALCFVESLRH
jgi:hypothetical protein